MKLIGVVGSLRKGSFNRALMEAVRTMLPPEAEFEYLDIGGLPLFNQDEEQNFPAPAREAKEKLRSADGILIATPEYNRSMPGMLKNALDWTSRPYGDSAWDGKKVFVMGASGGNISTALAQYDLKKVLLYLNTKLMGQPEVMIGGIKEKLDAGGKLADEKTLQFLRPAVEKFIQFVQE